MRLRHACSLRRHERHDFGSEGLQLQPHDLTVEAVSYHGRKAVRVMPAAAADAELVAPKNDEGGGTIVLSGLSFHNGTIKVDVAGKHGPGRLPMLAGSLVWPSG